MSLGRVRRDTEWSVASGTALWFVCADTDDNCTLPLGNCQKSMAMPRRNSGRLIRGPIALASPETGERGAQLSILSKSRAIRGEARLFSCRSGNARRTALSAGNASRSRSKEMSVVQLYHPKIWRILSRCGCLETLLWFGKTGRYRGFRRGSFGCFQRWQRRRLAGNDRT